MPFDVTVIFLDAAHGVLLMTKNQPHLRVRDEFRLFDPMMTYGVRNPGNEAQHVKTASQRLLSSV